MGGGSVVTWRGRRFDPRTRDQLVEVAATVAPYVNPTQGSYNTSVGASAGTHAGGGAVDISVKGWSSATITAVVRQMRIVGFAAWYRPASKSWAPHIHGISIGCPDLSAAAADQVTDYRNGRNGLANNGPDNGPRVGFRTWEDYLRERDDDMPLNAADKKWITDTIKASVRAELDAYTRRTWILRTTWADWIKGLAAYVPGWVWGYKNAKMSKTDAYSDLQTTKRAAVTGAAASAASAGMTGADVEKLVAKIDTEIGEGTGQ